MNFGNPRLFVIGIFSACIAYDGRPYLSNDFTIPRIGWRSVGFDEEIEKIVGFDDLMT